MLDFKFMNSHREKRLNKSAAPFFENIIKVRTQYGERFIRMREFYLAECEYFFR
tara:strand:- start:308 stop:469 length:162 start_codon:yes stop_codon:yes gene_type:complete